MHDQISEISIMASRIQSLNHAISWIAGGVTPCNRTEIEGVTLDLSDTAAMLADMMREQLSKLERAS